MRTLLITVLLSFFLACSGQDTINNKGHWRAGITFSQDTYVSSSPVLTGSEVGYHFDPEGFSFTAGFTGMYSAVSKFDFGSGIYFSQKNFTGTYYCNLCDFFVLPKPEAISLHFIEVPLFARYNILNRKFGIYAEAGLTNGYLLNDPVPDYGAIHYNKYQLSGNIGLGINLDLGRSINISLSSACKHPFTGITRETSSNFNSWNIAAGLTYRPHRLPSP